MISRIDGYEIPIRGTKQYNRAIRLEAWSKEIHGDGFELTHSPLSRHQVVYFPNAYYDTLGTWVATGRITGPRYYALEVTFFVCDTCAKKNEGSCQGHNFFHQPLDWRAAVRHMKSWDRDFNTKSAVLSVDHFPLKKIERTIHAGPIENYWEGE